MEMRVRMLSDYDTGNWSVSELCRRYGVCRDTFYAWHRRRASGEERWFLERSHAPLHCHWRVDEEQARAIVALRQRFPHFGPRKVLAVLKDRHPGVRWPAASTIGDLLKRAGLVERRRRRRRPLDQRQPFAQVVAANDEWCCDFKGWFRTRDQRRIDPLTITDSHSRYLIEVRIAEQSVAATQPIFTKAFCEYGLPAAMRCDNGSPFASSGAGGLTRLSAWWLKLGLALHFIRPSSPQENGRHERMHRTLRKYTASTPAGDAAEQQARFDAFRWHYNQERPHEALDQCLPGRCYTPSPRPMPKRPEDPWYDASHQVRRVRSSGEIKWRGERLYVSEALVDELVGVAELESGDHVVRFCSLDIGLIERKGGFRRFAPLRNGLREAAEPATQLSAIMPVQDVDNHPG
jgi:transposase InsO family protein